MIRNIKVYVAYLNVFVLLVCLMVFDRGTTDVKAEDSREISLYVMSSDYDEYLVIPDNMPKEYDIKANDSTYVSCRVVSGRSAQVNDGVISPKSTVWYWNGSFGSTVSSGNPDETVEIDYTFGDSVIEVTTTSGSYNLTVHVVNYAEYYAEKTIDEYLASHIKDTMTFAEKLDVITAMPAQYPYSAYASGYVSMIVKGGGDCWGSSYMILRECEKLGINARIRIANRDLGAGSGHRNVIAWEGDDYYELEAGYGSTSVPRYYNVKKRDSLFCYYNTANGYVIYQYDGGEELGTTLVIPSEYRGQKVVGVKENALYGNSFIKEIVVSEGIEYLESMSFGYCSLLEKITLPSTLSNFDGSVLWNNPNLKNITVSSESNNFKSIGNVVYSKDMTKLVYAANVNDSYAIPSSVKEIGKRAFGYNRNLKEIDIPASVEKIDEGAFFYCLSLENANINGNVTTIEDYAFHNCPKLSSLYLPESLTQIGEKIYGFANTGKLYTGIKIYGVAGSSAQEYADSNEIDFVNVKLDSNTTGLKKAADGNWYYYKDGKIDFSKTGIVTNDAGAWYVEDGKINFNYSGVVTDGGKEYVVKYGYMSTGFYGLVKKDNGTWAYAEAGVLTYKYTGLAKNDVGWWYITDGVIDFSYTGIGTNATGDYRVVNGQIDFTYNGWFNAKGNWWYMKGGMVDKTVDGLVKKGNDYYYVKNGEINFNYRGIAENAGKKYYVWDGHVDFSYDGTYTAKGITYVIRNGIVQ